MLIKSHITRLHVEPHICLEKYWYQTFNRRLQDGPDGPCATTCHTLL